MHEETDRVVGIVDVLQLYFTLFLLHVALFFFKLITFFCFKAVIDCLQLSFFLNLVVVLFL